MSVEATRPTDTAQPSALRHLVWSMSGHGSYSHDRDGLTSGVGGTLAGGCQQVGARAELDPWPRPLVASRPFGEVDAAPVAVGQGRGSAFVEESFEFGGVGDVALQPAGSKSVSRWATVSAAQVPLLPMMPRGPRLTHPVT